LAQLRGLAIQLPTGKPRAAQWAGSKREKQREKNARGNCSVQMGERRADRADGVVIAATSASSAEGAAREIAAAITSQLAASGGRPELDLAGLVCFVCSSYDAARFASEIHAVLPGTAIFGCTTAGELSPALFCRERRFSAAPRPANCHLPDGRRIPLSRWASCAGISIW